MLLSLMELNLAFQMRDYKYYLVIELNRKHQEILKLPSNTRQTLSFASQTFVFPNLTLCGTPRTVEWKP